MSNRLALREIEKKMWLRSFEHGMWDIGIGSVFLMFGLSILTAFPALSAIWIVLLIPSLRETGRKLVIPRIGHVSFRAQRRKAKGRLTGILMATSVIGVGVFLFVLWLSKGPTPAWAQWVGEHLVLFIGLIWGGGLAIAGWLVDFPRLYGYGALMIASLVITDLVPGYHLGISLLLVGGVILLTGLALLLRFLRRYPPQKLDEMGESADE